jgi:ABC-type dipeptide/oligopeptide/nickel transport system ATPase subunit
MAEPLVTVTDLTHRYHRTGPNVLTDVGFAIQRGDSFGIVGESGSGKSTIAKILCGMLRPTSGTVAYDGRELYEDRHLGWLHEKVQMVMQDPYSSLNPRARIGTIISRPLIIRGLEASARRARIAELLTLVGLDQELAERLPSDLSGGQRQRVAIARALAADPQLLLLDEPTSALDLSTQAQIINLLQDLRERLDLTYVFVSHNLALVAYFCDSTLVMRRGEVVERGQAADLFFHPQHEYTTELMAANAIPRHRRG